MGKNNVTLLPAVLVIATATLVPLAHAADYQQIQKQLNVISSVIKTTIKQEHEKGSPQIQRIETTYLAGQGAVFTIDASTSRFGQFGISGLDIPDFDFPEVDWTWGRNSADVPAVPVPPKPPSNVTNSDTGYFSEEINDVVEGALEKAAHAYESAVAQMNESRKASRELIEQERELTYALRELERQERNLALKRRNNESLAVDLKEIENKKAQIKLNKQKLEAKSQEFKSKRLAMKQAQEKAQQQYFNKLELKVAEGLCLYGNGLKALPADEKVSLILKNAGGNEGRSQLDKIVIFSKADIKSCVIDDINSEQLLAKATKYSF